MLSVYKFQAPFSEQFKTASGVIPQRNGFVLTFESDSLLAFGEISPLPGFSKENPDQILAQLTNDLEIITEALNASAPIDTMEEYLGKCPFPSMRFGLSSLVYDLTAKRNSVSLHEFIAPGSNQIIQANAVLGITSPESLLEKVEVLLNEGFNTLKCKVGVDPDLEMEALANIRKRFKNLKIRIDANGSWSTQEAMEYLGLFSQYDIEYCEQPISADNESDLFKIADESLIPVAADESVRDLESAKRLIESEKVKILILKPALFGSISEIAVTKSYAASHGIDVVFTTSFDGVTGRIITAALASGLGSQKYAQGLATGNYMIEAALQYPNEIREGKFVLPDKPGIGHPLKLSELEKII